MKRFSKEQASIIIIKQRKKNYGRNEEIEGICE